MWKFKKVELFDLYRAKKKKKPNAEETSLL